MSKLKNIFYDQMRNKVVKRLKSEFRFTVVFSVTVLPLLTAFALLYCKMIYDLLYRNMSLIAQLQVSQIEY